MSAPRSQLENAATKVARVVRLASAPNEVEIVERLRQGERWAEESIYRHYAPGMLGTAIRMLRHRQDAEDAVHDAFILAFQKIHTLEDPGAFRSWLTQITVRACHRRLRRRSLRRRLGFVQVESDTPLASMAPQDASAEQRAELRRLDAAVQRLNPDMQVAWVLRYVEGYPLNEVAAACDCSLATAKRRLAAAQRRLRGVVDAE